MLHVISLVAGPATWERGTAMGSERETQIRVEASESYGRHFVDIVVGKADRAIC